MRVPSFTDRILVYARNRRHIQLANYAANMELLISDHRPVFVQAKVTLAAHDASRSRSDPKSVMCGVA
jgi:hypothetical protein